MNFEERAKKRKEFVLEEVSKGNNGEDAARQFDRENPIIKFERKKVGGKWMFVISVLLLAILVGVWFVSKHPPITAIQIP